MLTELVDQAGVSDIKSDKMMATVRSLGDTIGMCDKLLANPVTEDYEIAGVNAS